VDTRPRVLLTLELPADGMDMLRQDCAVEVLGRIPAEHELAAELARHRPAVLVTQLRDRISAGVVRAGAAHGLHGICNYAAGCDNIDLDAARRHGVEIANTPEAVTTATAELTLALMLAVNRRVLEGNAVMQAGAFPGWAPGYLLGPGLSGLRLGIIGMGRIGSAVARLAHAFGMTVVHTPARSPAPSDFCVEAPLETLLAESDVVSLHLPLTASTRHLLDSANLRRMKRSAIVINTGRGGLIDEAALAELIQAGDIAGAGLDVHETEPLAHPGLLGRDNVVLLPHVGTATIGARQAMARSCAASVLRILGAG
jgi:glyoxylate reductase